MSYSGVKLRDLAMLGEAAFAFGGEVVSFTEAKSRFKLEVSFL